MKIGMITDSLGQLSFSDMLKAAADLEIQALEFACGNWSTSPHVNLPLMLESGKARAEFMAAVKDHGFSISALNCSGNQLHPGATGLQHHKVVQDTIKLAGLLEIDRVVMMSGLPGGPGDANPNWIITDWPPECLDILDYQWNEKIIPYWKDLTRFANNNGIHKLCLELHGHQAVYNVHTLFKLRDAVGETVGANYDPSHPMWMNADPLLAVRILGKAIYHVHAKDTRVESYPAGIDGTLEARAPNMIAERAWNYITLGYGHSTSWWKNFCTELKLAGYDDVLSIEHEDLMMTPMEGMEKSVRLLREVIVNAGN